MTTHTESEVVPGRRLAEADALRFILAGNAIVTLRSAKTGARFTYKVQAAVVVGEQRPLWHFVRLLTGPDNEADYTYLGTIFDGRTFRLTAKSAAGPEAPSYKAFAFVFHRLVAARLPLPDAVEVWHEGRCGRCGRLLTVPESVERGLGPDCAAQMGVLS